MSELYWYCPECKRLTDIEEVVEGAVAINEIKGVVGDELVYGDTDLADGFVDRYQCCTCGCTVKNDAGEPIDNGPDLVRYLQKHKDDLQNSYVTEMTIRPSAFDSQAVRKAYVDANLLDIQLDKFVRIIKRLDLTKEEADVIEGITSTVSSITDAAEQFKKEADTRG